MDTILHALNAFHQSNLFTVLQPVFLVVGVSVSLLVGVAVTREDIMTDLRAAIRMAGYTEKAMAITLGFGQGLLSMRLSAARPLSMDCFSHMPPEVMQWFAVLTAQRVGIPAPVEAGARLARRQARMALSHSHKAGVA